MNTAHDHFRAQLLQALPALRRYCHALTGHPHNAEDLLQSAVEKALSRWQQYQPDTHFDRWLYRLCRNLWIDMIRRDKPTDVWEDDAGMDPHTVPLEQLHSEQVSLARVQEQMHQLSNALRTVLYLVAVEGRSYQETAELLEIPTGTVMSRLARARQQLSAALGGMQEV